ncbi:MAG: TVP38/TMEM64 family protein [Verrucomicrobiota bacterium]
MNKKISEWPWKLIALGAVVAGLLVASRFLPLGEWTESFSSWVKGQGALGILIFMAVYILGTVLFLPGSLMTLAAGVIFGLGWGIVVALTSATIGASLSFLIGRYVARDAISKRVEKSEKFKAVDAAIGEQGWKIVGLLRLSPVIPFNFANYFFGITRVRFWPYVFASFFGMAPGTSLYVYLGYAGKATLGGAKGKHGPAQYILLGVGLAATIAVTIYVTRLARRKLQETKTTDLNEKSRPTG